jgi:hypothetical protein
MSSIDSRKHLAKEWNASAYYPAGEGLLAF